MPTRVPESLELLWEKVKHLGQPGRVMIPESALRESVGGKQLFEASGFDDDTQTIKDVTLIAVGWSLNNRYYSAEALRGAAKLFEGRKGYINHDMWSYSRDMRDLCCVYSGVYFDEACQKLKAAQMRVFSSTPNAWVYGLAREAPDQVGLSVVVEGQTLQGQAPDGRTGTLVQAILTAHSCDVVPEPAAGGGVEPATEAVTREETSVDLKEATLDHIKKERPDLLEAMSAAAKPDDASIAEAVKRALDERDATQQAEAQKAKAVDTLLEGSGLPKTTQDKIRPLALKLGEAEAKDLVETQKLLQAESVAGEHRPAVRDGGAEQPDQAKAQAEATKQFESKFDAALGVKPAKAEKEA